MTTPEMKIIKWLWLLPLVFVFIGLVGLDNSLFYAVSLIKWATTLLYVILVTFVFLCIPVFLMAILSEAIRSVFDKEASRKKRTILTLTSFGTLGAMYGIPGLYGQEGFSARMLSIPGVYMTVYFKVVTWLPVSMGMITL